MVYPVLNKSNNKNLIYEALTYEIRKAIFNVYNELGFGHKEQVYQKALANTSFALGKDTSEVGLGAKFVANTFETQLLQYLKTTGYQLGLLVNFGSPRLYIKRLIWTPYPRKSVSNQRKSL